MHTETSINRGAIAGLCNCDLNGVTIGTTRSGNTREGELQWNVEVINNCACPISNLVVSCKGFASTLPVNPALFMQRISQAQNGGAYEDLRLEGRPVKKNAFAVVKTDPFFNSRSTRADSDGGSYPQWNEKVVVEMSMPPANSELLSAGTDTNCSTIEWMMAELIRNPNSQVHEKT
ncbi:unnamed protein product [Linum tenue]|uniref:C2 domain-containing protein n=1 Tax=Linum tenue TaxID=586396 RepID=A0AAV0Q218_9ROSI|nr:unnamed protein product [Linum tenue]